VVGKKEGDIRAEGGWGETYNESSSLKEETCLFVLRKERRSIKVSKEELDHR